MLKKNEKRKSGMRLNSGLLAAHEAGDKLFEIALAFVI
jgi:hypothetical protein